jgi:hypothetical protein
VAVVLVYKPKYYYWSLVDLSRKLILVGIVVFIEPGSTRQILAGVTFAAIGWAIEAYCKPFVHESENLLSGVARVVAANVVVVDLGVDAVPKPPWCSMWFAKNLDQCNGKQTHQMPHRVRRCK